MTAIMENPYGVKWSVFDPSEKEWIEKMLAAGNWADLQALDMIQITPEKEAEIQKLQAQFKPRGFQFTSRVQQEFEIWMEANGSTITPAQEAEWQAKMNIEKQQQLDAVGLGSTETAEASSEGGTTTSSGVLSNSLNTLKGLGEKSIGKLNEAGIYNIEQFRAMSHADRQKTLGPIVASNFKDFNNL